MSLKTFSLNKEATELPEANRKVGEVCPGLPSSLLSSEQAPRLARGPTDGLHKAACTPPQPGSQMMHLAPLSTFFIPRLI